MAEPELAADTRFRPRDGVLFRDLDGEAVLLDSTRGTYFGLNEVGTRAWALLAGGATLAEALAALLADFEAPREQVWPDLQALVRELARHELVEVVAP
jgi:Coenzyme PQQ synthesis protein D (PqqD)